MSPAQRTRFYFPAWSRVCKACGWYMESGRFMGGRRDFFGESPEVNALYQQIWDAAGARAAGEHRGLKPDDLRHGCHVAAFGRDKSSGGFSNQELDRVVALFGMLTNPGSLRTVQDYFFPENAQRRRYVAGIAHCAPKAYIESICADKFARAYRAPHWEELPMWALRQLLMTVKHRHPVRPGEPGEMTEDGGQMAEEAAIAGNPF